jgi:hypothetical protein
MHTWGEENVDWAGINDAAQFIAKRLQYWRVDVRDWKEKYGTVRIYCSFGLRWWQSLTHPGHVWLRWPRWLNFVNYPTPRSPFYWLLRLVNYAIVPFHVWLYKRTYLEARRRWPHLAQEIYRGSDYSELLGARVTNYYIWWPEWDKEPQFDPEGLLIRDRE